jgi:hypothetical protein
MRIAVDSEGHPHLLRSSSGGSTRITDLRTGADTSTDTVSLFEPEDSSLAVVAQGLSIPEGSNESVGPSKRARGLLGLLAVAGPLGGRELIDLADCCESDLHGTLGELAAGGLVERTTVHGERGYDVTAAGLATIGRPNG